MKARHIATGMIIDVYLHKAAVLKTEEDLYREKGVSSSCNLFYKESMLDFTDTIDWEQRRFEIAKEILANNVNYSAAFVVQKADELINELKKGKE